MEEIEVGEYVRTLDGIKKIIKANKGTERTYRGQYEIEPKYKGSYCISEKNIIKHSKNIIDLIEVGDIVAKVMSKFGEHKEQIDTILTQEQYENNCYRLEE